MPRSFAHIFSTVLIPLSFSLVNAASANLSDVPVRNVAVPRFFGAAANTTYLFNDPVYTELAKTQFSIFTPENEMKWENIQPIQGVFNFTPADEIVKFAKSVGARMRGHNFLWANQLPPWVNTSLTGIELDRILQTHIQTVMKHYKSDKIYAWDIINEMISDNQTQSVYKQNIWTQKLGEASLAQALIYARAADPSVKLYINDYGIEGLNAKSDAMYAAVKGFMQDGVPIDGVGFQCHFFLGQVPTTLQQNLQRFSDLGLDVAITEVDINLGSFGNETLYDQQAQDYFSIVQACSRVERCVSVTTWGITDNHSWIQGKSVLPWNGEGQAKPAVAGIKEAFLGAPTLSL